MKMIQNLVLALSVVQGFAFVAQLGPVSRGGSVMWSSATNQEALSLSLDKPLGMILEEVEEGEPQGVYVLELSDEGSAAEFKDQVLGMKLSTVMSEDVSSLLFDEVMEKLIEAPSPVSIEFLSTKEASEEVQPEFEVGTQVTIEVLEEGKSISIEAKVGDNLRKTLLENEIEVYKGLKQKLGNCGGGGQCTFCAAEFVTQEGWEPRSEYEDQKLKKAPNSRLACLNNIQGPATIKL